MNSYDGDTVLMINVVRVEIEGVWYVLEIAVLPNGIIHSIIQVGKGERK